MSPRPNATRAYRDAHKVMLRRRRLRWLAALACTSSAAAMLTGCGDPRSPRTAAAPETEQVMVYKSLDDCKAQEWDESLCDSAFADAQAARETQTGYGQKAQCEAEYGVGNCESRSHAGGSWFLPIMAGYMLHSSVNRMSNSAYQDHKRREQGGGAYPVYVDRNGQTSTYNGRSVVPLGYRVPAGAASLPSRLTVQNDPSGRGFVAAGTYRAETRGGFGRTSSFRGGCCG